LRNVGIRLQYPEVDEEGKSSRPDQQNISQVGDRSTQDESIPCTISVAALTLSLEDANTDGDISQTDIGDFSSDSLRIPTKILPLELTALSSQQARSADLYAPTLPYVTADNTSQDPSSNTSALLTEAWNESTGAVDQRRSTDPRHQSEAPSQVFKHDLPTQLYDRDAATQVAVHSSTTFYDRDAPTQLVQFSTQLSFDPDAPTQPLSHSMPTQVYDDTPRANDSQLAAHHDTESLSQLIETSQPLSIGNPELAVDTCDTETASLHVSTSQSSLRLDPNAPTQLLDINQATLVLSNSLSSVAGSSLDHSLTTVDVIESTQLVAPQEFSPEGAEDGPLSGTIEAPDSFPDIVSSTQPIPTKEPASALSAPESRHGSEEPTSQDPSQVYSQSGSERLLQRIRIPSTPIEVIYQQQIPAAEDSMDEGEDSATERGVKDEDDDPDVIEATQMPLQHPRRDQPSARTSRESSTDVNLGISGCYSDATRSASPKHGLDVDSGREDTPKPSKQIKRETTEETLGSVSRRPPSRTLTRRSTMDMDMHKVSVLLSAPQMAEDEKVFC
jgi:hypothetical protein